MADINDMAKVRLVPAQSVTVRRSQVDAGALSVASITANLPAVIASSGAPAAERFVEFFAATIRNRNTREAYARAIGQFLCYSESVGCRELNSINTMVVSAYVERTFTDRSAPTAKQHLAAIRRLFDWLVTGQIVQENPAAAVRGPSHIVREGKTPVLDGDEARKLLAAIDATTIVGLRDRALIAVMIYSLRRPAGGRTGHRWPCRRADNQALPPFERPDHARRDRANSSVKIEMGPKSSIDEDALYGRTSLSVAYMV